MTGDGADQRQVLVVAERRKNLDVIWNALVEWGPGLLRVRHFDQGISAIRSGFQPVVIVIDLTFSTAEVYGFLRSLFDEPTTRSTPVLGSSQRKSALFQLAPRGRARTVPFPSTATSARALLQAIASR